jgi:putative FmdB family regulatory protein
MPLYEYVCPHCELKFEQLRPFSRANDPATCPECKGTDTKRAISNFASFSRNSDGSTESHGGGGGCAGCAAGHCGSCGHHH